MIIDTHAHVNFSAFDKDRGKVIKNSLKKGVAMINVGSQYETSRKAVEISEKYDGVYAAVGLHPIHVKGADDFDYKKFKEMALSKGVVAIGETGLDYYYKPKGKAKLEEFKENQKQVLLKHLKLCEELNLPVVLHCRMAHDELIEILKSRQRIPKGVVHCFTGTKEQAKEYLKMGFYIGFTGIIFKLNLKDVVREIPLGQILAETDCPYLSPPSGKERNEPEFVKDVIEEIARIRGDDSMKLEKIFTQNAKKLFNI